MISLSVFISCTDKKQENITANNKVFMRYKFVKGDKFRYKLTSYVTNDESIQADTLQSANTKQRDTYIFDFEVLEVDTDNVAELSATISSLNVNISDGKNTITFDPSTAPNKDEQQKFMTYAIQYNSPFHARVNQKGEVLEISRLDKMVEKAISIQQPQQTLTAQQKAAISQDIDQGMIHPVVQLIFRELPANAVAKDSTWQKSYPGQLSVFKIQNTATFKLTDFVKINDENAAKVKVDLAVTWEGERQGEQNGTKYSLKRLNINNSCSPGSRALKKLSKI